jgi:NlpC/P60 family putative phage cell wall peptidase
MTRAEQHSERVIASARRWLDTPYQHQASLLGVGCDCLGLLRGVWREVVGSEPFRLPAYAPDWAEATGQDRLLEAAREYLAPAHPEVLMAGDVLLFRWRRHLPAKHCAIAVSPDRMIHAHDGARVCEVPISKWWLRHLAGRFRFPDMVAD